jgi:hypothetical protein
VQTPRGAANFYVKVGHIDQKLAVKRAIEGSIDAEVPPELKPMYEVFLELARAAPEYSTAKADPEKAARRQTWQFAVVCSPRGQLNRNW